MLAFKTKLATAGNLDISDIISNEDDRALKMLGLILVSNDPTYLINFALWKIHEDENRNLEPLYNKLLARARKLENEPKEPEVQFMDPPKKIKVPRKNWKIGDTLKIKPGFLDVERFYFLAECKNFEIFSMTESQAGKIYFEIAYYDVDDKRKYLEMRYDLAYKLFEKIV